MTARPAALALLLTLAACAERRRPVLPEGHGPELGPANGGGAADAADAGLRVCTRDGKDVARSASMKMDEVDNGLDNHAADMLECMRTRKRPACDIEDGLRSSSTCLLGVVALRTGERLEFDAVKQELKNPSAAQKKLFGREYRAPWKLA